MYKTKLQVHLTCPKHTRYTGIDPGAIKAGCKICAEICAIANLIALVRNNTAELEKQIGEIKSKHAAKRKQTLAMD